MNKKIIGISVLIFVIGIFVWIAKPGLQNNGSPPPVSSNGVLVVEESNVYYFGTISMAAGKVNHIFKVKNTGSEAVTINKIYTSCMCTTATLLKGEKSFGPYGMVGHGFIPRVNQVINPDEEAAVEVVFDPAAHGPAGVGEIERVVTLENNVGSPIEIFFNALVTP